MYCCGRKEIRGEDVSGGDWERRHPSGSGVNKQSRGASHLDGTPPSCSSASVLKRIEVIVEGYGNRRRQTFSPWHSPEEPRTMARRRGRLTEKLVAPHAGDAGFLQRDLLKGNCPLQNASCH